MKQIKSVSLLLMAILLLTSAQQVSTHKIYGTWRLTSGKTNGMPSPQYFSDRYMTFNPDHTFGSRFKSPQGMAHYNSGVFYLLNDTTMVTYHRDVTGDLGNTYTIIIKNDSLHFYGYFLRQSPQNASMYMKIHIDEWWVKADINQ